MQMVWHYDKVVEPEFPGRYVGAKHVDHQRGIPFRLQQGAALAGLGGGEERTRRTQDVARKSIACRSCHHQGLKPHSFHGSARLKPCPDTNQIITSCSRKCRNSRRTHSCAMPLSFPVAGHLHELWGRRPRLQPAPWRLFLRGKLLILRATCGSRGTRADLGVCPTNSAAFAILQGGYSLDSGSPYILW